MEGAHLMNAPGVAGGRSNRAVREPEVSRAEASKALRRAVQFFRASVGVQGGYVWRYSADLSRREGEGKVGETTVWVQPPGTPFVGAALLDVFEQTRDEYYLAAARETAAVLVRGQLHSGGWPARIELAPEDRRRFAYRADGPPRRKARDVSVLDDDMTQSVLRFLVRLDATTGFRANGIHTAALTGLQSVLRAQYPNGAWPQVYRGPADTAGHEARRARYRSSGEYPRVKEYWNFYTLNDGVMSDVIATLLLAARTYDDGEEYRVAALRGGEFLIRAQLPEPQPGWAQQYDFGMYPAWARKFEPPAVTGGESQGVMVTLLDLYEETGERKFLAPVATATAYFRRSLLEDGRLARFYELRTNRPLYFNRRYELTHDDTDLPTHYAFRIPSRLDAIAARHDALVARGRPPRNPPAVASRPSSSRVRMIIDAMDERGAWVEDGRMRYWGKADPTRRVIDPHTFVRNVAVLARFVGRSTR